MTLFIFDMGGVVARDADVFPDVLATLAITPQEFLVFAGEDLEKLFNGKVSIDAFWTRFSGRYGREVQEDLFGKFFRPSLDPKVIDLLSRLKAHARVVCGTNTFDPHYDYHLSHGHYAIFDAVFASNKMGLSKPDPVFYRYILEKEAVKPEDAFFVDDTEANVLSAGQMGIHAILFRDSGSLDLQIKNHRRSAGTFLS